MQALNKLIIKLLRETANKIEAGTCELTEDEAMDIASVISHQVMSKEEACSYLNISRSKFDALVSEGKLPKGRKKRGFKELRFYKDEIDSYLK